MKGSLAWIVSGLLAAVAAGAEDPAATLARGKLESDLGRHEVAAEAFGSVAQDPQATVPQRCEALARLGVARRDKGDASGSAGAFEEAWRTCRNDPEALRFLLQAVGGALPGEERWAEVWKQVTLDVDGRVPGRPQVRVTWPGVPFGLCPCSGTPVDLDLQDGDLQDIFRLFADVSGLNVVVQPGSQGRVTYRARQVPWDEALERMLAPNGLVARLEGNVLWIGHPREAGEKRSFTGAPIDFEYQGKELVQALRETAAHGGATVEVASGIGGRVTFKLVQVPWDQAFDLLTRVNGLTWNRKGDVLHVGLPRRTTSR